MSGPAQLLLMTMAKTVVLSESVFHVENLLYSPAVSFSAFCVCCTLSVGPLLVPKTLKHKSKSNK